MPSSIPRRIQRHLKTDALAARGRCRCGQPQLRIVVTNHIDVIGGAHNDGITWRKGESVALPGSN